MSESFLAVTSQSNALTKCRIKRLLSLSFLLSLDPPSPLSISNTRAPHQFIADCSNISCSYLPLSLRLLPIGNKQDMEFLILLLLSHHFPDYLIKRFICFALNDLLFSKKAYIALADDDYDYFLPSSSSYSSPHHDSKKAILEMTPYKKREAMQYEYTERSMRGAISRHKSCVEMSALPPFPHSPFLLFAFLLHRWCHLDLERIAHIQKCILLTFLFIFVLVVRTWFLWYFSCTVSFAFRPLCITVVAMLLLHFLP